MNLLYFTLVATMKQITFLQKTRFVLLISITIDDANKDIQAKHCFVKLEEVFSLFLCSFRYK